MICPLSPAHFVALGAFQLFAVLLFFNVNLAPLPLLIFILLCCITPLFPRLSFFLPIISRGKKGAKGVALTFDDGPDPEVTPQLLGAPGAAPGDGNLLRHRHARRTLPGDHARRSWPAVIRSETIPTVTHRC